jgi:hypothetical protein
MRRLQTPPRNLLQTKKRQLTPKTDHTRRLRAPNRKRNHQNTRQMQMRRQKRFRKPLTHHNQTRLATNKINHKQTPQNPHTLTQPALPFCAQKYDCTLLALEQTAYSEAPSSKARSNSCLFSAIFPFS